MTVQNDQNDIRGMLVFFSRAVISGGISGGVMVHATGNIVHSTSHTVHSTQYTVHSTQYTAQGSTASLQGKNRDRGSRWTRQRIAECGNSRVSTNTHD